MPWGKPVRPSGCRILRRFNGLYSIVNGKKQKAVVDDVLLPEAPGYLAAKFIRR